MKRILKIFISFCLCISISTPIYATEADYYDKGWKRVRGVYVDNNGVEVPGAYKRGIDVSSFQGTIDWAKVAKDDVSFAFIRCGSSKMGNSGDDYFNYNCRNALLNGIPIGIYYRTNAQTPEVAALEAQYVLERVKRFKITYPIAIDVEGPSIANLSRKELDANITAFCEIIKEAGYIPCIYSSTSWFRDKIGNLPYKKWVAQYGNECNLEDKISFWQCTSHGKIDGIDGRVDIDFQIKFSK